MKSILIGLLLICTVSFIGNAQIVKLKSSAGFVQTDDYVNLHYQFLGEGKDTIVVVHGGGTFGSAYLVPDLRPLAAHHTILFFDQAGAGYSTVVKDTARYSMNSTLKDIEVIRKHFKQKTKPIGSLYWWFNLWFYATTYPDQ
ncbi:MAG: alpha/beta hydrolase [Saprospiraceae bacterium]|nr:alpha/beta hydrolase [Saprospiraceae bacterium]